MKLGILLWSFSLKFGKNEKIKILVLDPMSLEIKTRVLLARVYDRLQDIVYSLDKRHNLKIK
jgi:hypothetical protein